MWTDSAQMSSCFHRTFEHPSRCVLDSNYERHAAHFNSSCDFRHSVLQVPECCRKMTTAYVRIVTYVHLQVILISDEMLYTLQNIHLGCFPLILSFRRLSALNRKNAVAV
jgi:hypothetical protein